MKKSFFVFSLALLSAFLILTSCLTTRTEEQGPKVTESKKYKTIEIAETKSYLKTEISYPEFEAYTQLNKIISNTVVNNWKNFSTFSKTEWEEMNALNSDDFGNSTLPPFEYYSTFEVTYSGKIISVLINNYTFSGGAHGYTSLRSYNYDTENEKLLNIIDFTGWTYQNLSKFCLDALIKKLITENKNIASPTDEDFMRQNINEGVFPDAGNYQIWTVKDKNLTIYFEPYQVAPYAYGIQKVDIRIK